MKVEQTQSERERAERERERSRRAEALINAAVDKWLQHRHLVSEKEPEVRDFLDELRKVKSTMSVDYDNRTLLEQAIITIETFLIGQ